MINKMRDTDLHIMTRF